MAIFLQGRIGGDVERIHHHRLALQLLSLARQRAARAQARPSERAVAIWSRLRARLERVVGEHAVYLPSDLREERAIAAIDTLLYAALAVEAGANEIGEDFFDAHELKAFLLTNKRFQQPNNVTKVMWRWSLLFRARIGGPLDPRTVEALNQVERLAIDRNVIAHYELSANATRQTFRSYSNAPNTFVLWDAGMVPSAVKTGPIAELFEPEAARRHIEAAEGIFARWRAVAA